MDVVRACLQLQRLTEAFVWVDATDKYDSSLAPTSFPCAPSRSFPLASAQKKNTKTSALVGQCGVHTAPFDGLSLIDMLSSLLCPNLGLRCVQIWGCRYRSKVASILEVQ